MNKMMRLVWDVEVYKNLFTATFKDYDTKQVYKFEISQRKNKISDLVEFLKKPMILIGFNSVHYDNLILNGILKNYHELRDSEYFVITTFLKSLSTKIIEDPDDYKSYAKYKYNQPWETIDLFLYWSKMLRISKKLSLKSIAVNMNWYKIQELPIEHDALVREDQIDGILEYNLNDVEITEKLCHELSSEINLRYEAKKRYGLDCLNWDGVKLGLNILVKRYCDRTNKSIEEVMPLRTYHASIDINQIILPIIKFQKGDETYIQKIEENVLITIFKSFYGLLKYLRTLKVSNTNEINCRVFHDNTVYDIKSGGLHSVHNPTVVYRKAGYKYKDVDVEGYYPTLGTEWQMIPEHLGPEMAEELGSIKNERTELKRKGLGKSNAANLLKLSLNGGFYGNTNNEYTPMYDTQCMLKITINGQLLLLMLAEQLNEYGAYIDMANTDGLTIIYPEQYEELINGVMREWEKLSRTKLEEVEYIKVARMNINNYLAIYEGGAKEKGMFLTNPNIDMSRDFLIISKALKEYFMKGTSIEQFIRNHQNIYDFTSAQKVDSKYTVFHNGEKQQRLNRYFVSPRGAYLYKSKDGKKMDNMLKGFAVKLFNNYEEKEMKDYEINYPYYISKTREVLNELEPIQTSLF